MKDELGVETLESYFFEARQNAKRDRLAEYCRKDAYVCEGLVNLFDPTGQKNGLCNAALTRIRAKEEDEAKLLKRCKTRTDAPFACVMYTRDGAESQLCREAIERDLLTR